MHIDISPLDIKKQERSPKAIQLNTANHDDKNNNEKGRALLE